MKLPSLLVDFSRLTKFQRQEFSKYWFDLSKLVVASLILKFFEPSATGLEFFSIPTIVIGLTVAVSTAIVGLRFAKEVKNS